MLAARNFPQCRLTRHCAAADDFPHAWADAESGLPIDMTAAQLNRGERRQDLREWDARRAACRCMAGRGVAGRDSDYQVSGDQDSDVLDLACREMSPPIELGATDEMRAAAKEVAERLDRL